MKSNKVVTSAVVLMSCSILLVMLICLIYAVQELLSQGSLSAGMYLRAARTICYHCNWWIPRGLLFGLLLAIIYAAVSMFFGTKRSAGWLKFSGCSGYVVWSAFIALVTVLLLNLWVIGKGAISDHAISRVIIVTVDTLRADHLGCYGYNRIRTPGWDKLARRGILFQQMISASPVTAPSHASIFSGYYPLHHGVRDNGSYYLGPRQHTLAEILSDRGYSTAAFVGSFVLDRRFGFDQGFDHYNDDMSAGEAFKSNITTFSGHVFEKFQRKAGLVNEALFPWLQHYRDEDFFLWIHYYDPHRPYAAPSPWNKMYPGRAYDGEVAYTDQKLEEVLNELETLDILENTLIIVLSDHGEGLGEHEKTHGMTLYDPLIRIPLVFVVPDEVGAGTIITPQVRSVDIVPTVLDLLDIKVALKMNGESLARMMFEPDAQQAGSMLAHTSPAYSETYCFEKPYQGGVLRSLRLPGEKYITKERDKQVMLYDLHSDPGESENILAKRGKEAASFATMLNHIIETNKSDLEPTEFELAGDTAEKLKTLGYIIEN